MKSALTGEVLSVEAVDCPGTQLSFSVWGFLRLSRAEVHDPELWGNAQVAQDLLQHPQSPISSLAWLSRLLHRSRPFCFEPLMPQGITTALELSLVIQALLGLRCLHIEHCMLSLRLYT